MSYNPDETEQDIIKFWKENNSFEKSIKQRPEDKPYVFYDGPPFATGLPHYGHIVASTMKDAVPRFWTMRGYRVERRWGWDCHGLPIENMIEEELELDSKQEIEEYGVDKFNMKARESVMEYADQWEQIIPRLGRWVDMENDYKTMDKDYMESVWWVFKQLWDRDFVYKGRKPMHICPRCSTPLAQGEVAQGYEEVKDLSVTARFEVTNSSKEDSSVLSKLDNNVYLLAWTTTPWTFPGNVALALGEDITYSIVEHENEYYIVAEDRLEDVFEDQEFEQIKTIKGSKLLGLEYKSLFPYFADVEGERAFTTVAGDFVDTEEGTGVVHIVPAFGEEDYQLYQEIDGLPFVQHVDMQGKFIEEVKDFAGEAVKTATGHPEDHPGEDHQKADIQIIKWLYHNGMKLFDKQKITHRYPHCWRCDTPLLNYATESWFIDVPRIKDQMLENNQKINWVPEHMKEGRFGDWLEGAREWAVSRDRYWGAPIPIWESEDGDRICVGSIEELQELSGKEEIEDLHSHVVDEIEFEKDGKEYQRIDQVFDCWFESGSMPYGQQHYPFENKNKFEQGFPAKFIAEGEDQTRGWFYTLHILATILTQGEDSPIPTEESKPAFENVIVNGMVLAEDGKKMSKSLGNYPDPMDIVEKYGADALRFYLLKSPVMRSEKLRFSEDGVEEIYNKVVNMVYNIHNFYSMYDDELDQEQIKEFKPEQASHTLDQWAISRLGKLIETVTNEMEEYHLEKAARPIEDYILDLSQWYLRRSRKRFKEGSQQEKNQAGAAMHYILKTLSKVMAPFTPFIVEYLYQELSEKTESVHLQDWPETKQSAINENLEQDMETLRQLAEMGQALRQQEEIKVRQALSEAAIFDTELTEEMKGILAEELNVHEIVGQPTDSGEWVSREEKGLKISLNIELSEELKKEGAFRELVRNINQLRKQKGLSREESVNLRYSAESEEIRKVIEEYEAQIKEKTNLGKVKASGKELDQSIDIKNSRLKLSLEC